MSLPNGHVEQVCLLGQGEKCCAFLAAGGPNMAWECAKGFPDLDLAIRLRLSEGKMVAQGDNCSGPPLFARGES